MILKTLNGLFLLAYLLSALVQYNDPDAALWIALYLAAAGMCVNHLRPQQRLRWPAPLILALSLLWILVLMPSIVGQVSGAEIFESVTMQSREVEEAREIGGLLLVAIWAAVLTRYP